MKRIYIYTSILAAVPMLLSGCVDQDYSLKDIDKTTRINVDNLTLPVNIDPITLGDIFGPSGKIQPITIGDQEVYAVTEHGEINSKSINIPSFTIHTPKIQPSTASFNLTSSLNSKTKALTDPITFDYSFNSFTPQDINVKSEGIDSAVKELYNLTGTPTTLKVILKGLNIPDFITFTFPKLHLKLLEGLMFENIPSNYSYNSVTGDLEITNLSTTGNEAEVSITLEGIDFTKTKTSIKDGTFTLSGKVDIADGILRAQIDPSRISAGFTPDPTVSFSIETSIGDFTAQKVSGMVDYKLTGDGLNIAPVSLSDVPDFLNQEGSDLKLANPQIYLNLNNPVAEFGLYYQTGVEFIADRPTGNLTFAPDNNEVIATKPNIESPYNFELSPEKTNPLPDIVKDYEVDLKHIPFTGLSNLLSGDGLPEAIEIKLIDPGLPLQPVTDFKLDNEIKGINGSYDFIAPIALKNGSKIIYSDTQDGWYSDDLDKLTIELLSVEADVTSTIPLGATFTAYPIDKNGQKIETSKTEAIIPANADDKHVVIKMQGPIKELDGVTFTATVEPGSENALSPAQTITLKNLKATVSGYYTVE